MVAADASQEGGDQLVPHALWAVVTAQPKPHQQQATWGQAAATPKRDMSHSRFEAANNRLTGNLLSCMLLT